MVPRGRPRPSFGNLPDVGKLWLGCLTAATVALLSCAPQAGARVTFKPRIRGAMGIIPAHGQADIASGKPIPVVYHGGSVMRHVTIHTVFWAPSGFRFSGSPSPGVLGYEPLIQRFFTDVAASSGSQDNLFSVLPQYGDGRGPGSYTISYSAAADTVDVDDAFPARSKQCPSPAGIAACVTDHQVQHELDKVIQAHDPHGHGLHDLWVVF